MDCCARKQSSRFKLPVSIGKLFVEDGGVRGELLQLEAILS
jgi:hypothetical protein